ncbi:MAG TPA: hypothetical protein VGA99_12340, partial [bacterium]
MKKPRKKKPTRGTKNGAANSPLLVPPSDDPANGRAEPAPAVSQPASDISPSIEADFVLGNYLDDMIAKNPRKSQPDETATSSSDDSEVDNSDVGDISDFAIETFLKTHMPALRAEVDWLQQTDLDSPPEDSEVL